MPQPHDVQSPFQDIDIDVVAVLNDTTGTLMACAFKENTCQVGVIVGTGTNACYMEKISRCEKMHGFIKHEEGDPDEVGSVHRDQCHISCR